jgi:outer membrane protein assembly factor BamD
MKPEDRLALADELSSRGKCRDAIVQYEKLLSEFPRPQIAESAKFNLARCRMENEDYDLAVTDFRDFTQTYPSSDLVDNAMYMIALCYLKQSPVIQRDQAKTLQALDELNLLLRKYPASDVKAAAEEALTEGRSRLAEREYASGQLYFRLGDYASAAIYFDYVASEYADTPWVEKALLAKAETLERQAKIDEAKQVYQQIIDQFPAGSAGRDATRRLKELGGDSQTDSGSAN